jgi:hypothetical protein
MRKLLLTAALVSAFAITNAQQLTSKNGTPILPEAGEWSIGFDAIPVLEYFGNLFNNHTDNDVMAGYTSGNHQTIVGRYMKDENTAYRLKLGINMRSSSSKFFVPQDNSTVVPTPQVEDERSISSMNITIGAGIQKYRGKGRLKGIYGAELMVGFGNGSGTTEYTYGNAFSAVTGQATSTDFGTTGNPVAVLSSRQTESTSGGTFGLGVRGFIGVEYFFAPKMSLGAEYGWGIGISSQAEGETTVESTELNTTTGTFTTKTNTTKTAGDNSSNFNIGVDNGGGTTIGSGTGAIMLNFYF